MNQEFVHWLAPMDEPQLKWLLSIANYKRQFDDGEAILIGYSNTVDYPDHKNLDWLDKHLKRYFYIDRIIVNSTGQGQGYGKKLYRDVEEFAKSHGYSDIACEVNTKPNNPGSHAFHKAMGYEALGDADYPSYNASLRYYKKTL